MLIVEINLNNIRDYHIFVLSKLNDMVNYKKAYRVLFMGTEYSVLIPKDLYPNKIDVVDTCDFCVIIRNKDGFSYENVTINDIRNSLKNNDYPKQTDLLNAVRRWNEFDFLKENDVCDTCCLSRMSKQI